VCIIKHNYILKNIYVKAIARLDIFIYNREKFVIELNSNGSVAQCLAASRGQAEGAKATEAESSRRCRLVEGQDEQVGERSRSHYDRIK